MLFPSLQKIYAIFVFLFLAFFTVAIWKIPQTEAVVATCSSSGPAQNNIMVAPSHGSVFYVDTGITPKLDAGYIGYQVGNRTGSTQNNLWAEVSSFSGDVVSLSNADDSMMQISSLANNATSTSYFMLKATGATNTTQAHTLKIYNGRPDLNGSTVLYECRFSFSKVQETIKAAANKVADNGLSSSNAIEVSDTSPELGQSITISVEGQTGQIGNGSSPDGSIVWLTPAAVTSWPTRALRLESVSITFDKNRNWNSNPAGDQVTYTNQLLISSAKDVINNSEYRASYTFRVIGRPNSSVKVVPVAEISSGTQVKHADTSASGATLDLSFTSLQINASLNKSVPTTTGLEVVTCADAACTVPGGTVGQTYVAVPYRLTGSSGTATTLSIDEFVDTPGSGIIFKPNSATITDIDRTGVAIADPVYISSESGLVPRPNHFVGPFNLNSGTNAVLNYFMWVPVGTYTNMGYAKVADTVIGATASSMSQIRITSDGSGTVDVVVESVTIGVTAVTEPATNVTTSTVTLNATVDPNGSTPLTGTFLYGTNASLVGATTATATTPGSGILNGLTDPTAVAFNITGLTPNTTYYYRVVVGDVQGDILSFTTTAVTAPPTVTAQSATDITNTTATLNGSINPNLTSVTGVQFIYSTSPTLSSGVTTSTQDDGTGSAALTLGGSSLQTFTQSVSSLTPGTTYYFKIRACTSSLTGSYPNVACTSYVDSSILNFVPSSAPTATTTAATVVASTSATLNATTTANYATTTVTFIYSTSSDLSTATSSASGGTVTSGTATGVSANVSGLTASTTYYFKVSASNSQGTANGSILSFTTLSVNRTLTISTSSFANLYQFIDSPPTITATSSAGGGTITYSSTTPDVCSIDASTGVVTFTGVGTCTLGASITSQGEYTAATATSISFTVSRSNRTLRIDDESYTSSYAFSSSTPRLTSTASAGAGSKTYTSNTESICTVNESTGDVTFVTIGTCRLVGHINANGGYNAADSDSISFTINALNRTHSIDRASYLDAYAFTSSTPTLTSTPSAGAGTKNYTSLTTDVCTVVSNTGAVTFSDIGTCTLKSTIASNGVYNSATSTDISFTISRGHRTLGIDAESYTSAYAFTSSTPTLTSTPSVGAGTKTFTSNTPEVCTVHENSGVVTFVDIGTCTLVSHITLQSQYNAADSSSISFEVNRAHRNLTIDRESYSDSYEITSSAPTLTATASAGTGTKTFTSDTPDVCTVNESSGAVTFVSTGTCTLISDITTHGQYNSARSNRISFSLTRRNNSSDPETDTRPRGNIAPSVPSPVVTTPNSPGKPTSPPSPSTPSSREMAPHTLSSPQTSNTLDLLNIQKLPPACADYLNSYIKLGSNNDAQEVIKLQKFLNDFEGSNLIVDGVYKQVDFEQVKLFQAKYDVDVLSFWFLSKPTGYVYKTTKDTINKMYCQKERKFTCPYFTKYLREGDVDDEVIKVKLFLNQTQGEKLDTTTNIYDRTVTDAVRKFQSRYNEKVLFSWNIFRSTGRWYQSSMKTANDLLGCVAPVKLDNGRILR